MTDIADRAVLKLSELSNVFTYISDDMKEVRFVFIAAVIFVFMFGSCVGSFLNVLIYRLPRKENFVKGRSHCPSCGKTLKPLDLIPLFSWIFLGGKCRYCKSRISPRYILVELITGISYCLAFLFLGVSWQFIIAAVFFSVLIILSGIDISISEIPYSCSGTVAVLGLICFIISFSCPGFFGAYWYEHLIGAVIVGIPFAILAYLGAMGGGDVQLSAAAGLLLGWAIVPALFFAFLTGAVFGIFAKVVRKNAKISFGPFLSIGFVIGTLWGNSILEWYLSFLG